MVVFSPLQRVLGFYNYSPTKGGSLNLKNDFLKVGCMMHVNNVLVCIARDHNDNVSVRVGEIYAGS